MSVQNERESAAGSDRDLLPHVAGEMIFAAENDPAQPAPMTCAVYDARPIANELSLDREGFRIIKHDSALAREGDVENLRRESDAYLEDLAPVIQKELGASWVVPRTASNTGVVVRSAHKIVPGDKFHYVRNKGAIEIPYPGVHIDYTEASALNLARAENYHRGVPDRHYSRLIIIQAWQAVSPPPQDRPLALMDASTLDHADTIAMGDPPAPDDLSGDAIRARFVKFNPGQRWYYFSNMVHDDVVLFKGYDSANDATPPHASFINGALGDAAVPRDSVEGRFFCYFE